jgi:hypothetical protein
MRLNYVVCRKGGNFCKLVYRVLLGYMLPDNTKANKQTEHVLYGNLAFKMLLKP